MIKFFAPVALAAAVTLPSTAFGAEINLTALGGQGTNSGTVYSLGSTYTVTDPATNVAVTFTALGTQARLTYQPGDGLGIDSKNDLGTVGLVGNDKTPNGDVLNTADEINGDESLKVTFSEAVIIDTIALTDIYGKQVVGWLWPAETGQWEIKDASGATLATGKFAGIDTRNGTSNGNLTVNVSQLASMLVLSSTNTQGTSWYDERLYKGFSLGGITFHTVSVPELSGQGVGAAAFLLFGAAQLLGGRRRRTAVSV
jgi:hypothetical protein